MGQTAAHTISYLRECFDHDRERGELKWRLRPLHHFPHARACNAWNTRYATKPVGYLTNAGRLATKIDGRGYLLHRVIWALLNDLDMVDVPDEIDHKDMVPTNNAEANLRAATHSQNQGNRRAYKNNTSGHKGVSWHKATQKWVAQIGINGKRTRIGLFENINDARDAYVAAANDNFGTFARAA
jgi:hypothetical protein